MFFILSINTKKKTARIVGHAVTLDDAIAAVRTHARDYVVSKNEHVLHRRADDAEMKFTERVHYFTRDCSDHVHQIDVFRQQTHKIKGYLQNSYKEESELVRRFAYDEYTEVSTAPAPAPVEPNEEELKTLRADRAKQMGLKHTNTVGGFPPCILSSLRESNAFNRGREASENNRLPPPFKHTFFPQSSDEEEESTAEE